MALTDAVNKQSANFDGVDIKGVLNKIASMKNIDEGKLVDAIVGTLPKNDNKTDSKNKIVNIADVKQ
jgi:hypothetical protein